MGLELPPGKKIHEFAKQFMKFEEFSEENDSEEFSDGKMPLHKKI